MRWGFLKSTRKKKEIPWRKEQETADRSEDSRTWRSPTPFLLLLKRRGDIFLILFQLSFRVPPSPHICAGPPVAPLFLIPLLLLSFVLPQMTLLAIVSSSVFCFFGVPDSRKLFFGVTTNKREGSGWSKRENLKKDDPLLKNSSTVFRKGNLERRKWKNQSKSWKLYEITMSAFTRNMKKKNRLNCRTWLVIVHHYHFNCNQENTESFPRLYTGADPLGFFFGWNVSPVTAQFQRSSFFFTIIYISKVTLVWSNG